MEWLVEDVFFEDRILLVPGVGFRNVYLHICTVLYGIYRYYSTIDKWPSHFRMFWHSKLVYAKVQEVSHVRETCLGHSRTF